MSDARRAAEAIAAADALVVTAGAGMGVDSGLPDFRGDAGFWRAYPAYGEQGLGFADLANPRWFREDPTLAWGFYGHRLHLYRGTTPHAGFALLRTWGARAARGAFVFTSNVDGQFQRAGFDSERLVECHGAIEHLQCTSGCGVGIFPADDVRVDVDPASFRARPPLPVCAGCGALARPNVLLFGDWEWDPTRTEEQHERFTRWLAGLRGARVVVVEAGAGTGIPTVRRTSETIAARTGGLLVRINVREPEVPRGHVGMAATALVGLRQIAATLGG